MGSPITQLALVKGAKCSALRLWLLVLDSGTSDPRE